MPRGPYKVGLKKGLSYKDAQHEAWQSGFDSNEPYGKIEIMDRRTKQFKYHSRVPTPFKKDWQEKTLPRLADEIKDWFPGDIEKEFRNGGKIYHRFSKQGWSNKQITILRRWVKRELAVEGLKTGVKYELTGFSAPVQVDG
jgi:hypothetical protein